MGQCAGVFGKWCVWAIMPTYEPKKIRYRYPGEVWIEIVGETYELQERVIANFNPSITVTVTGQSIFDNSFSSIPGAVNVPVQGQVPRGRYLGFFYTQSLEGRTRINQGLYWVTLRFLDTNNVERQVQYQTQWVADYWWLRPVSRSAQINLNPTNTETSCRFIVRDIVGNIVVDITRSGNCPEVQEIPEKCEFKAENKRQVGEWFNVFTRNMFNPVFFPYAKIEGDLLKPNCVRVFVVNPLNPLFKLEIAYVCADCPDQPPIVWVECPCDDCEGKKCPAGTVYRLLEGNSLLCLDSEGCVLASVPYDPKCEQPNCSCN